MILYNSDLDINYEDNNQKDIIGSSELDQQEAEQAYKDVFGSEMPKILDKNNSSQKNRNTKSSKQRSKNDFLYLIKNNKENRDHSTIESQVKILRDANPDLSLEDWSNTLHEKRLRLNDRINENFPTMEILLDFELSVKTILNIEDITLPFMGIVFAVPSSCKTTFFELLRKLWYSYYSDKFTARAFVSHSATVPRDKLHEIDMLPMIKDKILLTPELSPLFTGKDDDIKEQFGIITRVLDGKGLETNSGVHGKRGYYGNYMFTWLGAAVDIPYSVYKFLSTIGFKIYFLRLPRIEITAEELTEQLTSKKKFSEKIEEIENLLLDYLTWFEICPIAIGQSRNVKVEWDNDNDDRDAIKIISKLAILLAHIRGHVVVYRNYDHDDRIPVDNNGNDSTRQYSNESVVYSHGLPVIENPSRAAQQLYNLARGHALSYGRNYITKEDILLVIKVVLSTGSLERVAILDLLIEHKGTLTTSVIAKSLRIANNTAKRTMTEFKGLELVIMEQTNTNNSSNSEYKITLYSKFNWLLEYEFAKLREGYKPTDYKEYLSKKKSAVTKNTLVLAEQEQKKGSDKDIHKGKIGDSKFPKT